MKQYQQACIGAFIQNSKGEFLVVKRSDEDEYLAGMWELPGGGVDDGEQWEETVVREAKEETGLDVKVIKPVAVGMHVMEFSDAKVQRMEVTFLCEMVGKEQVTLSFEHSTYRWITGKDIETLNFTEYMKKIIQDSLANI